MENLALAKSSYFSALHIAIAITITTVRRQTNGTDEHLI
jgi:hypothetical protein